MTSGPGLISDAMRGVRGSLHIQPRQVLIYDYEREQAWQPRTLDRMCVPTNGVAARDRVRDYAYETRMLAKPRLAQPFYPQQDKIITFRPPQINATLIPNEVLNLPVQKARVRAPLVRHDAQAYEGLRARNLLPLETVHPLESSHQVPMYAGEAGWTQEHERVNKRTDLPVDEWRERARTTVPDVHVRALVPQLNSSVQMAQPQTVEWAQKRAVPTMNNAVPHCSNQRISLQRNLPSEPPAFVTRAAMPVFRQLL